MVKVAPFDAAKYLTGDDAQLAALIDAYESGHAGVINRMLEHVCRARKLNDEKGHGT